MRGLLVKEFTMLRKQSIFLFVFPIMFLTINKSDPLFMLPLTTFFFCVIEINFMYSDEISKWQHYSLVLPVSRNTVVISKYLQIAITALSLGMMGIVLSFILSSMGICSLESGIIIQS